LSSALAAPHQRGRIPTSIARRPDSDAVVIRLGRDIDATLRKGVAAVYGVLTQRDGEVMDHAVEAACRRLKSQLPNADSLTATAIQFRVVPIDERRLGVEAALIAGGGSPLGAGAIAPLALFSLEQSFAALTAL
jgi:hypothetical protein